MSTLLAPSEYETLTGEVLAHLDAQVESAARLLEVVLQQGVAIRARDVHAVVRFAGLLHGEMSRREAIESERSRLLEQSGALLGIAPEAVTLTRLATLMDPARAEQATARSAQLRGLLHELQREHACNRALMRLELSFLDHLMTSLALDGAHGYDPQGSTSSTSTGGARSRGALHVLDLRA
ncbi:MAG TPA: flagellar export chaperone FlgN [Solirubrobacteraceae bacterium]